jgi:hypothetical protein
MYFCYVDESGCTGMLPNPHSNIQPLFVIIGVIFKQDNIINLTNDFIQLKKRFFPKLCSSPYFLDYMNKEIKGSEIRKLIKKGNRNQKRFALTFIGQIVALLERYDAQIVGRIWIKEIGTRMKSKAIYTFSIQQITNHFQHFLSNNDYKGIVIADSRDKALNANVSHSIFTQKYKTSGDAYDKILEMPVYGHSDNHAGIQIADIVASAVFFPIAAHVYCSGHVADTTHHHPAFLNIRDYYGIQLRDLQYRYQNQSSGNVMTGGITVSDPIGHQNGGRLFS